MKYIVVLGDGMADEPLAALGGKTPLEYAKTPAMDALASGGEMGMVQNVPQGMHPGSEVANLSVMGYDPKTCFTGRSPLEALSVGVKMEPDDIIFRCNVVTLTEEEPYAEKRILDHSSGEISTEEADALMETIRQNFNDDTFQFYTGTSYRHIMVWKHGHLAKLEPPHDHLTQVIGPFLPEDPVLRSFMERSYEILNNHPVNLKRAAEGKRKAECETLIAQIGKLNSQAAAEAETAKGREENLTIALGAARETVEKVVHALQTLQTGFQQLVSSGAFQSGPLQWNVRNVSGAANFAINQLVELSKSVGTSVGKEEE